MRFQEPEFTPDDDAPATLHQTNKLSGAIVKASLFLGEKRDETSNYVGDAVDIPSGVGDKLHKPLSGTHVSDSIDTEDYCAHPDMPPEYTAVRFTRRESISPLAWRESMVGYKVQDIDNDGLPELLRHVSPDGRRAAIDLSDPNSFEFLLFEDDEEYSTETMVRSKEADEITMYVDGLTKELGL